MTNTSNIARSKSVNTAAEFDAAFSELYSPGKPSFFRVDGPLPAQGRTDTPLAATPEMTVVLKCYAACGENALHAHLTEDHTFIVLQGQAHFYGPNNECLTIGPMNGVLLPHGSFYRFQAAEGEPLVMIRVGCASEAGGSMHARIGFDGNPLAGESKENKQVDTLLSGFWFGDSNADR